MSLHRLVTLLVGVIVTWPILAGCSKPTEQKTDPEALKKEMEILKEHREREWGK